MTFYVHGEARRLHGNVADVYSWPPEDLRRYNPFRPSHKLYPFEPYFNFGRIPGAEEAYLKGLHERAEASGQICLGQTAAEQPDLIVVDFPGDAEGDDVEDLL